ncbi:MAG: hypothetical protein HYV63_17100 [Candidatus Schekmanbacteria bacterium]|nr:hypothetical protein [Candidatus Schekmanbacteria bacterium]
MTAAGETLRIPVPRKRCVVCKRTCSFLPPFLLRRRPWVLDIFAEAMRMVALEASTIAAAWQQAPTISARAFSALLRAAAR